MRKLCHCGAVTKRVPCDKCKIPRRHEKKKEWYDHKWRKLSEVVRANNPICQDCIEDGNTSPSTEVHHIIPIAQAPERRLDQSNIVALCTACHRERHRRLAKGLPQREPKK